MIDMGRYRRFYRQNRSLLLVREMERFAGDNFVGPIVEEEAPGGAARRRSRGHGPARLDGARRRATVADKVMGS